MQINPSVSRPILPQKKNLQSHWGNLKGSSAAWAILNAAQELNEPVLLITTDSLQASQLEDDLNFYGRELKQRVPISVFPDWETLPYDQFSPHHDIISQRLAVLNGLPTLKQGILIVPIATLMHRLPPMSYLLGNLFSMRCGDKINLDEFRHRMEMSNYQHVTQVMEHGEFTIRGSIIDLYPMGSTLPYRIELFDDDIDTIRSFDPDTQRSQKPIKEIKLLPAKEFPLTEDAITRFRQSWRSKFSSNPRHCVVYDDVSNGIAPAGIEYYLPLFFEKTAVFFDYLPQNALIIHAGNTHETSEIFWREIKERFEQNNYDITRPILPPQDMFVANNEIFAAMREFRQIHLSQDILKEQAANTNYATDVPAEFLIDRKAAQAFATLQQHIEAHPQQRILFCAETRGKMDFLASHDFEDIISVIDGRSELIDEVKQSEGELKQYLVNSFHAIHNNRSFHDALPGHFVQYGALADERIDLMVQKTAQIAQCLER